MGYTKKFKLECENEDDNFTIPVQWSTVRTQMYIDKITGSEVKML